MHNFLDIFSHRLQIFWETSFTAREMFTTIFKETDFWWVKIEALAWCHNHTLGIFDAIMNTLLANVQA